jgi:hypothetical protein
VADYLENKGLPLLEGADWWPDRFNLTARLYDRAVYIDFFVTHKVTRCVDPRNSSREILCWKFSNSFNFLHQILVQYPERTRLDFLDRLNEVDSILKVDKKIASASIDHLLQFFQELVDFDPHSHQRTPAICKIKEIGSFLTPNSQLHLDWLYFINQNFMSDSLVLSNEEEILIEDWQVFARALELLEKTPRRVISDVFFLGFLYGYNHM